MSELHGLVAYPSQPAQIGNAIRAGLTSLHDRRSGFRLESWEENDVPGRFIVTPVLQKIEDGNILVADITRLNFNVTFEIGYAIAKNRRVLLVCNKALVRDIPLVREVGIFDTIGHQEYSNSQELADVLQAVADTTPIPMGDHQVSSHSPVYILLPRTKGDAEIRLVSRIKKARLQFRSFDPEEQGRLSPREAIVNTAYSLGIVIPLLSTERVDSRVHNLRAAFVAGLATALQKKLLLLQPSGEPVPLDYRDLVSEYGSVDQIDQHISQFALAVTALLQARVPVISQPRTFLARLDLGSAIAENEMFELGHYFLETDEYQRTLRGEVQLVVGRKGSGKTAVFAQVRNRLRQDKQVIVLDLKPEGFQLLKFKELVLDLLQGGTKEHTITAFWEYLLLLEICHKLLQKDKERHVHDSRIYEPYQVLSRAYSEDAFIAEGDFAERMLRLTQRIAEDFQYALQGAKDKQRLTSSGITELLYKHDVAALREALAAYLTHKKGVRVLFDNLDKGWPPHGVTGEDLTIVRCLVDALAKLSRSLSRRDIPCHGAVFIRNDVYELLVDGTPDRGKTSKVAIDWTDPELLRELLRKRIVAQEDAEGSSFDDLWREICVSHIDGEESSQYVIDRSLMRPRGLICLVQHCLSHAVNLGHTKIQEEDIRQGEEAYSTDLVTDVGLEIRDVYPEARNILYEFMEEPAILHDHEVRAFVGNITSDPARIDTVIDLLLWYGVLGLKRKADEVSYIYTVKYDMKRLKALIQKRAPGNLVYHVNPAFWRGLEIQPQRRKAGVERS